MSSAQATIASVVNEPQQPLRQRWIFILVKKTLAHAVEFAALQALVELAALGEWAHDHIGGDREQAQVLLGARRAAAKIALDQGAISICLRVLDQQFRVCGIPETCERREGGILGSKKSPSTLSLEWVRRLERLELRAWFEPR